MIVFELTLGDYESGRYDQDNKKHIPYTSTHQTRLKDIDSYYSKLDMNELRVTIVN